MDFFTNNWNYYQETFPALFSLALNTAAALSIFIVGMIIARWVRRRLKRSKFISAHLDSTLRPVLASAAFYLIAAMTLYAVLREIGVDAASLLAVFGAAGLAIGLALKDTLSNIASGVMLIILRPLQVGEFIDTAGFSGTVQEIGIFSTALKNAEGLYLYVPNAAVWNARMTNFSRHSERKLNVDIGVGYDTDLQATKELMLKTMKANPNVQTLPSPPECHVMAFGDSAITLSCRCWLPADEWLANSSDIRIALKSALDKNGIDIPFPQRVVTTKS